MEKQQTDWIANRAGARSPEQTASVMEQLRRDLAAQESDTDSWEAACLKSVANLLDSLDKARGEQDTLNRRLADLHTDLETETENRQRLKETVAELEGQAESVGRIRQERDNLLGSVDDGAANLADARTELAELRAKVSAADAERSDWTAALEKVQSGQAELEQMRSQLTAAEQQRDEAIAERDKLVDRLKDYDTADEQLAAAEKRTETMRAECDALNRRGEKNLVELCDLRVQVNRLENDRDAAVRDRRKKIKKILSKVHSALDEAGAPRGEDLSYGERIRWLKNQLES